MLRFVVLFVAACGAGDASSPDAASPDAAPPDASPPDADPLVVLQPTGVLGLSPGNATGQDEDPSILVDRRGALHAAWYSNRNGVQPDGREDKEIFLVRSTDGATWSAPVQVTRGAEWAFTPSLAEDGAGRLHLAWWRVELLPADCTPGVTCTGTHNRIMVKSSPDGVTWSLDEETAVTAGPGDWLPSLIYDRAADQLVLVFAAVARNAAGAVDLSESTSRLYRVTRTSTGWSQPARIASLSPDGTHQGYPHIMQRADGTLLMTWTRWDGAASGDVLQVIREPSTNTMLSTSPDGVTWTEPTIAGDVGATPVIEVFPALYADHAGSSFTVTWRTTGRGAPNGSQVELAIDGVYPRDAVDRPELGGYTAKVLATRTPGLYWAAWVAGASPTQKIEHRFFRK